MLRCVEVTFSKQFGTERQTKDRENIHLHTYAFECVSVCVWIVYGLCLNVVILQIKTYLYICHTKNRIVSTNYIARLVLDVLLCVCVFLCYAITEVSMNKKEWVTMREKSIRIASKRWIKQWQLSPFEYSHIEFCHTNHSYWKKRIFDQNNVNDWTWFKFWRVLSWNAILSQSETPWSSK